MNFAWVQGGRPSATSMACFLLEDVAPVYREAEIRIVRVNTDCTMGAPEEVRGTDAILTAMPGSTVLDDASKNVLVAQPVAVAWTRSPVATTSPSSASANGAPPFCAWTSPFSPPSIEAPAAADPVAQG